MRGNHSFKKTAALVLSCVLALGAVPLSPLVEDAHAETTAAEPSAVAYATKDELEEIPTTDGADYKGDVTKVGRIKLGKNNIDEVMEWYILGSDPGVSGGKNNTAIFAASDMVTGYSQKFDSRYTSPFTHEYKNDGDMTYEAYDGAEPAEPEYVLFNHYGMSELRSTLKILATSQFSDAEQGIMQATTVDTPDYKANGTTTDSYLTGGAPRAVYTTSDVLYAAWGNPRYGDTTSVTEDKYAIGIDKTNIYIGSTSPNYKGGAGAKVINLANLGASNLFWLRSANAAISRNALVADSKVACTQVNKIAFAVRPASNLNLSSVMFASAASASGTDTAAILQTSADNKNAMMLRLNTTKNADGTARATDVKIGEATVYVSSNTITATKAAEATGTVTLIVQGKNANTDWYYSKLIESTTDAEKVTTENIVNALGDKVTLSGDTPEDKAKNIDLSKCEIWLETPVDNGTTTLSYAVKAKVHTHTAGETWYADENDHWHICTSCNEKMDVAEHSPSNWTPTGDKTQHTRDCDICHGETTVETEDHVYDWKSDEAYHWKQCTDCGHVDPAYEKALHDFDKTTYACHDCPYNMKTDHGLVHVDAKEEGCAFDGNIEYYRCDKEGHESERFVANQAGMYVMVSEEDVIIKAHHTYTEDSAWDSNVIYHWHICDACGKKVDETQAKHTYSGGKCDVCGRTRAYDDSSDDDDSSSYVADASTAGSAAADAEGSWSRDEQGLRFEYADGSYAKGTVTTTTDGTSELQVAWEKVKGSWYAFDADGYAMQDWVYDASDKSWYYCDEDNGSQSGWLYTPVDNCWYYLDPNSGAMHTGWVTIDGRRYYFSEAHNGTYYQDPVTYKWVYANPNQNRPLGSMYINTATPDGSLVGVDGAYIEQ